jgi:hypothetical protein
MRSIVSSGIGRGRRPGLISCGATSAWMVAHQLTQSISCGVRWGWTGA